MNAKLFFGFGAALAFSSLAFISLASRPHEAQPQNEARQRAMDRSAALALIDAGQFDAASKRVNALMARPLGEFDAIELERMEFRLRRARGDVAGAQGALDKAMRRFAASQSLLDQAPWLEYRIILDKADLAAFTLHDRDSAIVLYDVIVGAGARAQPYDHWIASQNAAMLCAEAGRYAEAIARVDAMLSGPASSVIDGVQLRSLRESQASWALAGGDLVGAFHRNLAIWNENPGSTDPTVLFAGVFVARMLPINAQGCAQRLAIATAMLARINEMHHRGAAAGAPSGDLLGALELDVLTIHPDSGNCGNVQISDWARELLRQRGQ